MTSGGTRTTAERARSRSTRSAAEAAVAPGVVQGDVELQPIARRGATESVHDGRSRLRGKLLEPAEQVNAYALLAKLVGLVADRLLEQAEEARDLVVRARPVLAREGVQGEH